MLLCAASLFDNQAVRCTVLAVASENESHLTHQFVEAGFAVNHIPAVSRNRFAFQYLRLLRSTRPACVHVHKEGISLLLSLIPRLLGIRVVRTVHSVFWFDGYLRVRKRLERWLARALGVSFVSISPSVMANELERFHNRSQLIMNWFDDRRFRAPTQSERLWARRHFTLAADEFTLAIIGNCSDVKNHAAVLRATALLPSNLRPTVLHAGDEGDSVTERCLADELGIVDRVRFLGPVDDIATLLWACDLYVMPSLYEGLGIAALEALATGLKVVVSDVPGLHDLAVQFGSILAVEPVPPSIASALIEEIRHGARSPDPLQAAEVQATYGRERGVADYVALYRGFAS